MKQSRMAAGGAHDAEEKLWVLQGSPPYWPAKPQSWLMLPPANWARLPMPPVLESLSQDEKEMFRHRECQWHPERPRKRIRDLVVDDQRLRNNICWFVFSHPWEF